MFVSAFVLMVNNHCNALVISTGMMMGLGKRAPNSISDGGEVEQLRGALRKKYTIF